ncbi:uncharacterized protein A4U43_C09F3360 [Asparagus officinalis]|uniref:Uncharacterized protein n=1 Tax=Asparagus officinalis TaxID=4686 RepID=A0A5P1E8B6_ASPOF|nr:uncharacterized protein A4U43_C09F3360 [Asparagus officinalis]
MLGGRYDSFGGGHIGEGRMGGFNHGGGYGLQDQTDSFGGGHIGGGRMGGFNHGGGYGSTSLFGSSHGCPSSGLMGG